MKGQKRRIQKNTKNTMKDFIEEAQTKKEKKK